MLGTVWSLMERETRAGQSVRPGWAECWQQQQQQQLLYLTAQRREAGEEGGGRRRHHLEITVCVCGGGREWKSIIGKYTQR